MTTSRAMSERIALACFHLAAIVALTCVFGVLSGSVPDTSSRSCLSPSAWS